MRRWSKDGFPSRQMSGIELLLRKQQTGQSSPFIRYRPRTLSKSGPGQVNAKQNKCDIWKRALLQRDLEINNGNVMYSVEIDRTKRLLVISAAGDVTRDEVKAA